MSIHKLNSGLPTSTKIELLNDMIVELKGQIAQAKFNKNEIDNLFSELGGARTFLRDQNIGNTEDTYNVWVHVHAESGYSIWKYSIPTYVYNNLNELYVNNQLIENRGLATSESVSVFDKVYVYDDDAESMQNPYTDYTIEANTEGGTPFELMRTPNDYLYVGSNNKFNNIKLNLDDVGMGYTLKVEYYSNTGWRPLTYGTAQLVDNTNNLANSGVLTWNSSSIDWIKTTLEGDNLYWIRISTTTTPGVIASTSYCVPVTSVIGLLALSSEQIINESWAWCSYGSNIYTTIRNIGNPYNEGSYYITSSSNDNNKRNFFIYNNRYTANYADSTYIPGGGGTFWKGEWNAFNTYQKGHFVYILESSGKAYLFVCMEENQNKEPPNETYWVALNPDVEIPEDTNDKVKYKSEDDSAGYIADKFVAGDGISIAEGVGVNENKLIITNNDKGSSVTVPSNSDFNLADLKDIDKANKDTGKILQVRGDGKHEYVTPPQSPTITTISDTDEITPDGSKRENEIYISALAQSFELKNPSGISTNGNTIVIQVTATGDDRNLTWGNGYIQLFGVLPNKILENETIVIMIAYFDGAWNVMNVLPAQEEE